MTIRTWLASSRDYAAGRRLYEVLGPNVRLKRTLSHGPSAYNTPCLAEELAKLLHAGVGDVEVPTVESTESHTNPARSGAGAGPKKIEQEKKLQRNPLEFAGNGDSVLSGASSGEKKPGGQSTRIAGTQPPAVPSSAGVGTNLDQLKAARRPLFDERSQLHARLELLPTDEERRVAAFRILELTEALDASFAAEKHLLATGTLPAAPKAAPAPVALPAELAGLTLAELKARRPNLASLVSKLKTKPNRAADLATAQGELARLDAAIAAAKANPND